MKKLIIFAAFAVMISPLAAQKKIDKHINFAGKQSLAMNLQIADSIAIHTWNKNEVYARASVNIDDNQGNEAYLTSFDESGQYVKITAELDEDYFRGKKNHCTESTITWEIFIPEKTDFTVETINGNITIDGNTATIGAKTISGFIDFKIIPGRSADLEFKTISGTMYSDMDIASANRNNGIPQVIAYKLNEGGLPVKLETISGDIFFRK
jgi:DUF4097 and DUF4098 domain-containing protein YvlB